MDPLRAYGDKKYWKNQMDINDQHNFNLYFSKVLKTLLHPNFKLCQLIISERRQLDNRQFSVGIQLRMNAKDRKDCGIRAENVTHYIKEIDRIIRKNGYSPIQSTLYISTDLPEIIDHIKHIAVGYNVIESRLFEHGHTSSAFSQGKPFSEIVKKVIADFVNVVRSDIAFVTWQSSLARLMCFAMYPKPCSSIEKL